VGLRLLQRVGPQTLVSTLNPLHVGLQSYWKLDESSGTATDAHSTNHLSDVNTVTGNPGKVGTSRQFTYANSEYLSIPSNASLQTGDIDFTIAGWVYLDSKSANQAVVGKWTGAPAGEYLLFYNPGTDRFRFIVCDTTQTNYGLVDAAALGSPATGTWYFIVAWHDATAQTVNIQVNNGTVNSASHPYDVQVAATAFRVGATGAFGQEWDGRVDELGLWKRLLTPAERTQLYASGSGVTYPDFTPAAPTEPLLVSLVSYWKLDEASGNAVDAHGTNHLTDVNTVTSNPGKVGTARQFVIANSEMLQVADNATLRTGDIDFTTAGWFYADAIPGNVALWGKDVDTTHRDYRLDINAAATGPRFILFTSSGGVAGIKETGTALATGTWYFVVAWHDSAANTISIQINDGTVFSAATTDIPGTSTAAFEIGAFGDAGAYWSGRIDEVGIWKRVLTPAERTQLYAGGAGVTYPTFA